MVMAVAEPKERKAQPRPYAALGRRVAAMRDAARLSQEELGKKAGISTGYVGLIEMGSRRPSPEILRAIARASGGAYADLAGAAGYADDQTGEITMPLTSDEATLIRYLRERTTISVRRVTNTIRAMIQADDELFFDFDGSKEADNRRPS